MKMVITLRNGTQISTGVKDFEVKASTMNGELKGIEWTYDDEPDGTSITWVDMAEVVAVHADRSDQAGHAASVGITGPPPAPRPGVRER